jgi:hypothetical protein
MDSQQKYPVGVLRKHPPINPLSLWERARVRVFRRPTEVSDVKHRPERPRRLGSHPSILGDHRFTDAISSRCKSPISPNQSPLLRERARVRGS